MAKQWFRVATGLYLVAILNARSLHARWCVCRWNDLSVAISGTLAKSRAFSISLTDWLVKAEWIFRLLKFWDEMVRKNEHFSDCCIREVYCHCVVWVERTGCIASEQKGRVKTCRRKAFINCWRNNSLHRLADLLECFRWQQKWFGVESTWFNTRSFD